MTDCWSLLPGLYHTGGDPTKTEDQDNQALTAESNDSYGRVMLFLGVV